MSASELDDPGAKSGPWWGWRHGKQALEYLFWSGRLSARRRPSFERVYDLTERMIPAEWFDAPQPTPADAHKELLVRAARVARDRHRARPRRLLPAQHPRLASAARRAGRGGSADPGGGRGLGAAGVPAPRARRSRAAIDARALLSPFDSLVWERSRTERSSTSATASRSTRRSRSGCTATTCCRSCSVTRSSRAST